MSYIFVYRFKRILIGLRKEFMLTAKQEKFIAELIKGNTQRGAYKAAYNCSRMKDETVDKKAYALLKQEKIRSRYEELKAEVVARDVDDAESIRNLIIDTEKAIVKANLGQIYEVSHQYDEEGNLSAYAKPRSQEEIDKFDMRAVQEIRFDSKGRPIFKLYDKQPAVNTLRELFGLDEQQGDTGIEFIINGEEEYKA